MQSDERILFCPLNWGLGHGSRDIPIIRLFTGMGYTVLIAASGRTYDLLKKEFPSLNFTHFPDYNIKYSSILPAAISVLLQVPKITMAIIKEHFAIKKLITKNNISAIISDNRYGLFSDKVPSVFISHQILIKPPKIFSFIEIWLWLFTASFAQKHTFSWIPDVEGVVNLSGELSHKFPLPANGRFIGPLADINDDVEPIACDMLVLISGPEPARSAFEKLVLMQLEKLPEKKVVVLLGKPEGEGLSKDLNRLPGHQIFEHLERKDLARYLKGAELIVSRSGYTTVMEVAHLGKKAVWVPTPGQTEQEYLANHLSDLGYYRSIRQKDFNLTDMWENRAEIKGLKIESNRRELIAAVGEFAKTIRN